MLRMKTMPEQDDPSSSMPPTTGGDNIDAADKPIEKPADKPEDKDGFFSGLRRLLNRNKNGNDTLRDVIEEYIEDHNNNADDNQQPLAQHETTLISNILNLQDMTVMDVMIPRADIVAIDINSSEESLMEMLAEKQYSRIPIYRENLDDILGTVHIKDILSNLATKKPIELKSIMREAPIVSPSLPVMDLMLLMQRNKKHMVFVVDEYGGIDGLVTVGDVIESIVGEIDDEFDLDSEPTLSKKPDGSVLADARYDLEDFEEEFGSLLSEEEREENDTLGGLVFYTAGRIPARGEVIQHDSGMSFEIMDADQRRINKLRIRNIQPVPSE